MKQRAFLIVLDSVGIGAAPDSSDYADCGANTLAHTAQAVNGLNVPTLKNMGLGNIPSVIPESIPIQGVPAVDQPLADFGAMREVSQGKDTTTGHWEMAGLILKKGFRVFPANEPSFPPELISEFETHTGRKVIGNKAASGTQIIEELGPRQMRDGCWIVYTSADSVFQIAAHETIIPLDELYSACKTARQLCNHFMIGRVIARPYIGEPGNFKRTESRRDYSYPLPEPTILDRLSQNNINVITVGKLDDIFMGHGITKSIHVENNSDAQHAVIEMAEQQTNALIFANLIDFDMLYGHRRDPRGYAQALEASDIFLAELINHIKPEDILIITADHGNDPLFKGTDHTREYVPLLVYRKDIQGKTLGIRQGFYDVAQSIASFFMIDPMPRGKSFI